MLVAGGTAGWFRNGADWVPLSRVTAEIRILANNCPKSHKIVLKTGC